jgi:hypothetical protein
MNDELAVLGLHFLFVNGSFFDKNRHPDFSPYLEPREPIQRREKQKAVTKTAPMTRQVFESVP